MKIINQSCKILDDPIVTKKYIKNIEQYAKVCYKSEHNITEDSCEPFIKKLIKNGHESPLEHEKITVCIICSRGISHELVRHRLASYSQESTRYCKYDDHLTFVKPYWFTGEVPEMVNCEYLIENIDKFGINEQYWLDTCFDLELNYKLLLKKLPAQACRDILPNCLKTELIMTANLREWRHIFKLRTSKAAHPDMQNLMNMLLLKFMENISIIFDDLY